MILATTKIENYERFIEIFSTKGAEKRALHGSKGATVFRDPVEDDRVWVLFDWDAAGWKSFVSDPEVPAIMQEAGHIRSRRAGADYRNLAALENRQVMMLRAVGEEGTRQIGQYIRNVGEVADARGHDQGFDDAVRPFGEFQDMAFAGTFDRGDRPVFEIRHQGLLEVQAMGDEGFDGRRDGQIVIGNAVIGTIFFIRVFTAGIVQARGKPVGLQVHALGHLGRPGIHCLAEYPELYAAVSQVGGN